MDVFVRTAVWFVAIARNYGQNHAYSEEDKRRFLNNPDELVSHAKDIEDQVNEAFNGFFRDTTAQSEDRRKWTARMANLIRDERLREGSVFPLAHPHPHPLSRFVSILAIHTDGG